jgi:hypothetical protein
MIFNGFAHDHPFWHSYCSLAGSKTTAGYYPAGEGGEGMAINFHPDAEQMIKEVEECTLSGDLVALLYFCNICVHKIFDRGAAMSRCIKCSVQQGITRISKKDYWPDDGDGEFLGVC